MPDCKEQIGKKDHSIQGTLSTPDADALESLRLHKHETLLYRQMIIEKRQNLQKSASEEELRRAVMIQQNRRGQLGEILTRKGVISVEQLEHALKVKMSSNKRLGDVLLELGYVTQEQIIQHVYTQLAERIQKVLLPMIGFKEKKAEFYDACSEVYPEHAQMWRQLAADIRTQITDLHSLISAIYRQPDLFTVNMTFTPESVDTVLHGVFNTIERVRSRSMSHDQALYLARDIENSVLVSRLPDVLTTNDADWRKSFMRQKQELFRHRKSIADAIDRLKK